MMDFLMAGMKHCGKSTHGKALAKHLHCSFFDTDDLIVKDHFENTGEKLSCREFFKKYGADGFQKAEARVFKALCERVKRSSSHHVISLGGRLACNPDLEKELEEFGTFVYIKTEPKLLFERVMRNGRPPFLSEENPYGDFAKICKDREPYYERFSNLTIELGDEPLYKVRRDVIAKVEEYIHER